MENDTIICNCMNITVKDLKHAVKNGADTLMLLQDITGAGTVCGICIDEIEKIMEQIKSEYE